MSHKMRTDDYGNPVTVRVCVCGKPCRKHTFFCSDECRFWAKVSRGPGCWLWTASLGGGYVRHGVRTPALYGQFTIMRDGRQQHLGAHVYSFILAHGPIPDGAFVCHGCDVPHCVNPAHLFLGDHQANMTDAQQKGRLHKPRPTRHKLTAEAIADIRGRVFAGELRVRVAEDYGITKSYVTKIMDGTARQYDAPLVPAIERAS